MRPRLDEGDDLKVARTKLRERQGEGARYDSFQAPANELAWARSGTAFFARKLNELGDSDLRRASLLPGWNRAALIAHVGYNARALVRLCEWARTGVEHPMYASTAQRNQEISDGATLPARALRHLFTHSAVHLDVEWRDLSAMDWKTEVVTAQGRTVPVAETAWMRTREVWIHTVDLGNGASFPQFPRDVVDALISDVLNTWSRRGESPAFVIEPTDRDDAIRVGEGAGLTITGRAADLAQWLTGRGGEAELAASGGASLPKIPRWL